MISHLKLKSASGVLVSLLELKSANGVLVSPLELKSKCGVLVSLLELKSASGVLVSHLELKSTRGVLPSADHAVSSSYRRRDESPSRGLSLIRPQRVNCSTELNTLSDT